MPYSRLVRGAILTACCYSMMAVSFANACHPFLMPDIADALKMGNATKGLFLSCAFWGMGVALLVAGPLADRTGFRPVFAGAAVLQALGLLMVGHAQSPAFAIAGACVAGIGTGAALNLAMPLVCLLFPRARAAVCNFLQSFCSVGAVVVIALGLILFGMQWDWRGIYRLVAVLVLGYGVAFLFLPLPRSTAQDVKRTPVRQLVRSTPFLLMLAGMAVVSFTTAGVSQWLPVYVEKMVQGPRSIGIRGAGLMLFSAAGALGNWLTAALVQRFGARRLVLLGGLLGFVSLLVAVSTTHPIMAICFFALLMLGMVGMGPILLANGADRFPGGGATMYSLLFTMGNAGCVASPLAIGLLAELWNLRAAFATMAAGPVVSVLILLALQTRHGASAVSHVGTGGGSTR